jgi:oligopeptide/dipeptide ABC transporter ATP-binding protein
MTVSETDYERTVAHSDPILQMRDTTVSFDMERGESRVLDDVDMDIERNEVLGVVGESGSGKSMFASALLDAVVDPGYLRGDITYNPGDGESLDVLELSKSERKKYRWEEVSMVFQGAMSSFNPVRDVETHFVETLEAHDYDVQEGMDRARQLLSDLYLEPERVLDSYPHELSGGMKQRALIALSLVLEPEVLVMDEPTAALDLLMQRSIISMLRELRDEFALTIVFITHDLPLVAGLSDRIGVMYSFEFIEVGETRSLLKDAAHPYTRALLRSVPSIESDIDEMEPIEGARPDPVNIPTGCSFHPRCPIADDRCEIEDPDLVTVDEDHEAACFYTDQARNELSYTLDHGTTEDDR